MHVQIVTFSLDGISEGDYIDIASQLAPRFAALPGLLAKVWLESPESGAYGAVYLWEDEEAMDRFMATDLFEGTNRAFGNLVSEDFSVLENLTRATQPVLTVLEDSRAWPTPAVGAPASRPRSAAPKAVAPKKAAPKKAGASRAGASKATAAEKAPAADKAPAAEKAEKAKKAKVTKVSGKGSDGGGGAGTPTPAKARSRARKTT